MANGLVHRSRVGTYHPEEEGDETVAWTVNDTRGYTDGGPACDTCEACDCHYLNLHGVDSHGHPGWEECIGLSFAFVCLDGSEALCEDCAEKEGIEIVECDCADKA